MTLKKRQAPRTQKPTGATEMPNANDRLCELEAAAERMSKAIHQQAAELERVKSRQQLQDQLNDEVGVTLANVDGEQKHLRALAMAASEDIGDLAGHEESIQHIQSQVGILSAVLQKRFEGNMPRKSKSFATLCYALAAGVVVVAGAFVGKIAGWW